MKVIPIRRPLVTKLAGLPDGRFVAGFDDGSLQIFDVYPGHGERVAWDNNPPYGGVNDIAVLPSGQIAISFADCWLRIYDPLNYECVGMREYEHSVNALAVLPDDLLACGTESGVIHTLHTLSGKPIEGWTAHDQGVLSIAALPGGLLASGSYDGEVKIWDLNKGTCKGTIECGDALADVTTNKAVHCMSALPDGFLVLGVVGCSNVLLCSIEELQDVGIFCQIGLVRALEVSPNGRLAVATEFRAIALWNVEAGNKINALHGHHDHVRAMTILADGRLVSADDDTIRVWDL